MRFFRFTTITVLLLACVVLGSACTGAKGERGDPGWNMTKAAGYVLSDGTMLGEYNVTSCMWNGSEECYEIVIPDFYFPSSMYVAQVTPSFRSPDSIASVSPSVVMYPDGINVYLTDPTGVRQQGDFHFMVLLIS